MVVGIYLLWHISEIVLLIVVVAVIVMSCNLETFNENFFSAFDPSQHQNVHIYSLRMASLLLYNMFYTCIYLLLNIR